MAEQVGSAFVTIRAVTTQLRRDIQRALGDQGLFGGMKRAFAQTLKGMQRAAAAAGKAMAVALAAGLAAGAGAAGAAGGFGLLAGAVAAVGGAMAGLGHAGIVAMLAVKGASEAMEQGTAVGQAYRAGLDSMKTGFDELKQTAAEGTLAGFQKAVEKVNAAMPALNAEMARLAPIVGDIGQKVVGGLVGGFQTFEPLAKAVLGDVNNLAGAFEKWATGPGGEKFAATLLQNYQLMRPVLGGLFGGLGSLFGNLTPMIQQVLGDLGRLMQTFDRWASGPGGVAFARTLSDAYNAFKPVFGQIAGLIGDIVPLFVQLGITAAPGLAKLIGLLRDGLVPLLERVLPVIGEGFVTLVDKIEALVGLFQGLSAIIRGDIAGGINQVTESVDTLAGTDIQGLQGHLSNLIGMFPGLKNAGVSALQAVWSETFDLRQAFGNLGQSIPGLFSNLNFGPLESALSTIGSKGAEALIFVNEKLADFVNAVTTHVLPGVKAFVGALVENVPKIVQGVVGIADAFAPIIGFLAQIAGATVIVALRVAFEALAAVLNIVGPVLQGIGDFLSENQTATLALTGAIVGGIVAYKTVTAITRIYNASLAVQYGWTTRQALQFQILRVRLYAIAAAQRVAAIATAAWNAVLALNPIGLVVAAIVALVAAFVIAYKRSETFRAFIQRLWKAIQGGIRAVWSVAQPILAGIGQAFMFLLGILKTWWGILWNTVFLPLRLAFEVIKVAFTVFIGAFQIGFAALQAIFTVWWAVVWNTVFVPFRLAFAVVSTAFSLFKNNAAAIWAAVKAVFSVAWAFLWNTVFVPWRAAFVILRTAFTVLRDNFNAIWNAIKNVFSGAWNFIRDRVFGPLKAGFDGIKNKVSEVRNWINTKVNEIVGFFTSIPGKVAGLAGQMLNAGKAFLGAFVRGLGDVLVSTGGAVADLGKKIINGIISAINSALQGINDFIPNKIAIPGAPDINLPDNPLPMIPHFRVGGRLNGRGTGTSDSNLIAASDGEWIINARSSDKYNSLLRAINDDKVKFATPAASGGTTEVVMPQQLVVVDSSGQVMMLLQVAAQQNLASNVRDASLARSRTGVRRN